MTVPQFQGRLKMAKSTSKEPYFSSDLFDFLRDLKRHNHRDWFEANKERYLRFARDPLLSFITDFGPYLNRIDPNFVTDPSPVGGSLFRIYRDVRFSKDKQPYKTNVGAYFKHRAGSSRGVSVPGFYLHIQPGASFAASGLWHPEAAALAKVRKAIVEHAEDWKKTRAKIEVEGDSLKRPPRGFDPNHEHIEDIKRKDFVVVTPLSDEQIVGSKFMEEYVAICKQQSPLVQFLAEALGLSGGSRK
jgi:uncharacterized protein (TIGR02453 family)